jgi:hypothetical protein
MKDHQHLATAADPGHHRSIQVHLIDFSAHDDCFEDVKK